ncbi:MAG: TlpA disulfide reductase family protein [Candidatus Zixiibacteriota bacterium]
MVRMILSMLVVLAGSAFISCSSSESTSRPSNNPSKNPYGAEVSSGQGDVAATSFSGVRAVDVDGNTRDMSEWLGKKAVVVNFWGTWCPPCRREIPGLVQLYKEYRNRGIEIISLAIERTAGPREVRQFAQQAGMEWVMLMSNDQAAGAFGLGNSVPTTIFYDARGREVARQIGARSYDDFKRDFEKIASRS